MFYEVRCMAAAVAAAVKDYVRPPKPEKQKPLAQKMRRGGFSQESFDRFEFVQQCHAEELRARLEKVIEHEQYGYPSARYFKCSKIGPTTPYPRGMVREGAEACPARVSLEIGN